MACDRFRRPFLLCTTFRSFLCTVHDFLCAFSAKVAAYSLVKDNVYSVIRDGCVLENEQGQTRGYGGSNPLRKAHERLHENLDPSAV